MGGSGRRLSSLAWRPHVWWGCVVDAVDLAQRFGLGGAARLSDGPVARGKLTPNPRSPERTDSAAWVGEVLEEPHTRELLDTILTAAGGDAAPH